MDYQSYSTRTEARKVARRMRSTGWPEASAISLYLAPWQSDVGLRKRCVWVIRASKQPERYLRVDGFVR